MPSVADLADIAASAKVGALAVRDDLDELARFSAPGPGITRLAFGDEDARARHWFKEQCERIGLDFRVDRVGNCFGFTPGAEGHKPLLIGSHLDSVPGGGRYDGVLGVVAGLRVLERFVESGSDLPLAVANFSCEESTRFGFGSIGSRFLAGDLDESGFEHIVDTEGRTLAEVLASAHLEAFGAPTRYTPSDFRGYLEVHIDQGTILTSMAVTVGVVTRIAGVNRTQVVWTGEEAHSGGQVRSERRDALVAAATFIGRANDEWVLAHPDEYSLSFTVGRLSVEPNSPNTVPGRVEMILDVRSADAEATQSMLGRLATLMDTVAELHRVEVRSTQLGQVDPVGMHDDVIAGFERAAEAVQVPAPPCISLAGHDALVIGRVLPTGMLLLANPSGISHAPRESVDDQAVVDGLAVLFEAIPDLVAGFEAR